MVAYHRCRFLYLPQQSKIFRVIQQLQAKRLAKTSNYKQSSATTRTIACNKQSAANRSCMFSVAAARHICLQPTTIDCKMQQQAMMSAWVVPEKCCLCFIIKLKTSEKMLFGYFIVFQMSHFLVFRASMF